jgi:hypothetical protein
MRVRSATNLLLLALVLFPLALTAQESERLFRVPLASFTDVAPGPVFPKLPQASGEKSPALAGLLNVVLPGVGNFYAGNNGHGIRHLAFAVGGLALMAFGATQAADENLEYDAVGGVGLALVGGVVFYGNWVWGIFSGIQDARAANRPVGSNGGVASILQPQLVPLGLPSAVGNLPGVTKLRLGLQLVRVTF